MNWKSVLILLMLVWSSFARSETEVSVAALLHAPQLPFVEREDILLKQLQEAQDQGLPSESIKVQLAAHYMLFNRFDLIVPLIKQLESDYKEESDSGLQVIVNILSGYIAYSSSEYSKAAEHYNQALELLQDHLPKTVLARQNNPEDLYVRALRGINLAYLQDYSQAIYELTQVHEIASLSEQPSIAALALSMLGDVSFELKNYEEALDLYQQAYEQTPVAESIRQSELLMSQAQMINIVGQRSQAFQLLDRAISQFETLGHKEGLAFSYLLKSYFYSKQGNNDAALEWIAESVALREALGVQSDIANAYVHYSSRLADAGQLEQAQGYAQRAADIVEPTEDLAGQWDAYANLAHIFNAQGRYQEAYQYMQRSERALLSKARLDITKETARLNSEFNLAKEQLENRFLDEQKQLLQKQNALLQTQLDLKNVQQSRNQTLLVVMSIAVLVFIVLSITIYRLYRKSQYLATRDTLTNLHNRRSILSLGEIAFASSTRYSTGLCIMMLDIDNFKRINDQHGHKMGDKVLKNVARICRDSLRESDLVGRIGGEEFLLILPQVDESDAMGLAQRIRKSIMLLGNENLPELPEVTVSIGMALKTRDCKQLLDLINQSDEALYSAKNGGRNQVHLYQPSPPQAPSNAGQ